MIRVLIADDHAIVRWGLRQILQELPGIDVVDEASNGQETLARVRKGEYQLVLLDISMPGISGLDVLKQLRAERPKLPVLMLSMHPEEQYAVRALKAGAAGYLTKETASEQLATAVSRIMEGRKYVSEKLAEHIASELDHPGEHLPHEDLSDREFQIMRLLASGKTVTEIGAELSLSVKTVSTYRTRLLAKMGFRTNADITRYALQHELLE